MQAKAALPAIAACHHFPAASALRVLNMIIILAQVAHDFVNMILSTQPSAV
jgi:hypothetical protein